MIVAKLTFYVFSIMSIIGAINVIFQRNPVHSVLWLIFTFFNSAGLFIILGAEFVAMILIVVYVGAVAVLFLFVVMMLDIDVAIAREGFFKYLPVGLFVGVLLLSEFIVIFINWSIASVPKEVLGSPTPPLSAISNTRALGNIMYTDYIYLFQVSGIILLVAMVGSIVLTHRRRAGVRRQNIAQQNARTAENTLDIVKVEVGKGIE
ncbi:MAG: NADH:ubiquinone oxidoreductase subunit J [Rhodospirillaceae bacterium]|nr:NADH:ubiquinone oxidoreductase subunit J [Rhodospirillaceae bacterium]